MSHYKYPNSTNSTDAKNNFNNKIKEFNQVQFQGKCLVINVGLGQLA